MRSDIRRRLDKVERKLEASKLDGVPDAELLSALKTRELDRRQLKALQHRIEVPFAASLLGGAVEIREARDLGEEIPELMGPLRIASIALSYSPDEELPSHVKDRWLLWRPQGIPSPDHRMMWNYEMNAWLVHQLIAERGGEKVIRREVARMHEEDKLFEIIPVYSDEEADQIVEFVDELETPYFKFDRPLLWWLDEDGHWCISYKPTGGIYSPPPLEQVRRGQKWTRTPLRLFGSPSG